MGKKSVIDRPTLYTVGGVRCVMGKLRRMGEASNWGPFFDLFGSGRDTLCVCGVQNANRNCGQKCETCSMEKALKYEQWEHLNRVYVYTVEIGVMGRTVRRGMGAR